MNSNDDIESDEANNHDDNADDDDNTADKKMIFALLWLWPANHDWKGQTLV